MGPRQSPCRMCACVSKRAGSLAKLGMPHLRSSLSYSFCLAMCTFAGLSLSSVVHPWLYKLCTTSCSQMCCIPPGGLRLYTCCHTC